MNWFSKKKRRERITQLAKIVDANGQVIGTRILIENHEHIPEFSDLVYFTVPCSIPVPNQGDLDRFDAIQDRLDELIYDLEFCCVGIMTIQGKRDWILYARSGEQLMPRLLAELGQYEPQMERVHDPRWTQYRDLKKM